MRSPSAVHRTTVDIDVLALEAARAVLGTRGYRDTINGALHEVERMARLRAGAAAIRDGELDLVGPDELEALRASR